MSRVVSGTIALSIDAEVQAGTCAVSSKTVRFLDDYHGGGYG